MRCVMAWAACVLVSLNGCTLCQSVFDHTYGAYGGRWQREDMCHGRVGSIIDPAPHSVITDDAEMEPAIAPPIAPDEPDEPTPAPLPPEPTLKGLPGVDAPVLAPEPRRAADADE